MADNKQQLAWPRKWQVAQGSRRRDTPSTAAAAAAGTVADPSILLLPVLLVMARAEAVANEGRSDTLGLVDVELSTAQLTRRPHGVAAPDSFDLEKLLP